MTAHPDSHRDPGGGARAEQDMIVCDNLVRIYSTTGVEVVALQVKGGADVVADHLEPGELGVGEFWIGAGVVGHDPILEIFAHGVIERRQVGVYAAGPAERRLILINLDYAPITPAQPAASIARAHTRADIWRLEAAALQHNTEAVIHELERTLDVSRAQARRIIGDEWGEPIVVVAKAMGMPADVLQRVLLFMNPRIGQSVDRVFALAELYGEVSAGAARRMVAIWREADKFEGPRTGHEPVPWRMAAENARRALSEVPRRPAQSRDLLKSARIS